MIQEPGDRKGRPYISCRSSVVGYVGTTLAVARQKHSSLFLDHSQALTLGQEVFDNET